MSTENDYINLKEENAKLQSAVHELSLLNDIATAVSSTYSVDKIIGLIVDKIVMRLDVGQCVIWLLDEQPEGNQLNTVMRKIDESSITGPYRFNALIGGWMIRNRKTLIVNDFQNDKRFSFIDTDSGIKSFLCVPLIFNGKLIGLIVSFNKKHGKDFIHDDERLLSIVAAQAANIIANAKMVEHEIEHQKEITENLREADKMKDDFLAQVSHEIRTPINIIQGSLTLIKDELEEHITEDANVYFNSVESGANRIIRTIDLILNTSSIKAGKFELNIGRVDLDLLIRIELLTDFYAYAKEKKLLLNYYNNSENHYAFVDMYCIKQILSNIIDNAIKFTDKGSIDISLKNNSTNKISISIKDTGKGITKEFLSDIFKPFAQEDKGYSRAYEGNGLGLTLAKQYIDANKGEIFINSEVSIGTEFVVEFFTHDYRL